MLPQISHAGAWLMPEGEGQIISTLLLDKSDHGYDANGDLTYDPKFTKEENAFYLEYGLSSKTTLVGSTTLQSVSYLGHSGRVHGEGIGVSSVGLRQQVWRNAKHTTSLQGSFILSGEGENIPDADLGAGGNAIELRGQYGYSYDWGGSAAFVEVESAWVSRGLWDSPDSFKLDLSLGRHFGKQNEVFGQIFYQQTESGRLGSDVILENESLKLQVSFLHKRPKKNRGHQFGVYQTLAGRNVVSETGMLIGFWQNFRR